MLMYFGHVENQDQNSPGNGLIFLWHVELVPTSGPKVERPQHVQMMFVDRRA